MYYTNHDKDLLLENTARVYSRLTFYDDNDNVIIVCNEDDYLQEWEYEDYRYVPEQGFIGQFVERLLDGKLINLPSDINLADTEFKMEIGIKDPENNDLNYYDYGRFLITKISETDTSGIVSFEAADYTKKFNKKYEDRVSYPCIASELLEDVCDQAGVPYPSDTGGMSCYVPKKDEIILAGNYSIIEPRMASQGTRYLNFTTTVNLEGFDSLISYAGDIYVHQKVFDADTDTYTTTNLETTRTETPSYTLLSDHIIRVPNFTNNEFVIQNNQFEDNTTCRDVVKAIAQLAYSWARVGTDNTVRLDFTKKPFSSVNKYTTIDTDTYYSATKTGNLYGPVREVIVGMSSVDGENVTVSISGENVATENTRDDVIVEQNTIFDKILLESDIESGKAIAIYDNPLTYTEQLRKIAVNGGARILLGIQYTPVEVATIGYPWLDGDDLVEVNNIDEETYYTYPFNRSIRYKGYIESDIKSIADGRVETEYKYEGDIDRRLKHTEIIVDKNANQISMITESVEDISDNISNINAELEIDGGKITQLTNSVKTIQGSTYTKTEIQQIAAGEGPDGLAVSKVLTMAGTFDINGMHYEKSGAETKSTINNLGLKVEATADNSELLFAGYDNTSTSDTYQQSIVRTENITINSWTNIGSHGRFQDYTDDSYHTGVGFFLR